MPGLWAPEIKFLNGQYYLYYAASEHNTYRMAAAPLAWQPVEVPLGPWIDSGAPVVEPHDAPCAVPARGVWVFDPDVVKRARSSISFIGSYFGGISARAP